MTKISQLSSIGDSLAIDDQFIIRDVSDVSTPNKSITISGITRALDLGSAAAPAIAFASDKNSGLYSPGADQVAISTNGTSRLVVDASGNVNIDSDTFYVDAANNRVGIGGITSPIVALHVTGEVLAGYSGVTKFVSLYPGNASQPPAIGFSSADSLRFVGTAEYARIDSSGRLLVGTSSGRSYNGTGDASLLTIEGAGTSSTFGSAAIIANNNNVFGGSILLGKSRGTAVLSNTIVQSGDRLGEIYFIGADGVDMDSSGAIIKCEVDGTPGSNDMPGRLVFSTTADGAASPTEAMRIKSTQIINLSNAPTHADNTAATAAGLAVGDVYKTVLGVLMIRF